MRIGLSSYTYTWAIGVRGYPPLHPLTAFDLIDRAHLLGVDVVQIADNLPLHEFSDEQLIELGNHAERSELAIEVGTRGIEPDLLARYVEIAQLLRSPLLRVVIAGSGHEMSAREALKLLRPQEPLFKRNGLKLAIENHERFSTAELSYIVEELGTDWAGICLDTVNSFGALEGPAVVVEQLGHLVINLHVKDFIVKRAEHMMGFTVEGRPVGGGQLNVPWLIDQLGDRARDITGVIELWTPPSSTLEATIAQELEWADESVRYLRTLVAA